MPQSAIIENSVYGKTKENEITESERRAQLLAEENGWLSHVFSRGEEAKGAAAAGIIARENNIKCTVDLQGNCQSCVLKAEYFLINKRWAKFLTRVRK